ncbi:DUF4136 domain-containing protein [Shewanella aestuarii]|uniref:DUF4136 domain-containing protein n=1 Tax=Shewanella aestuarii TaxID=1028752 RepID=A0A6G9QH00_9GAMM|nr:DUF4136 domain-containing protein [Shewanella aestuarii]QIR13756.1 DUF4136 domain-containing protein [Shewanella aestuarii]
MHFFKVSANCRHSLKSSLLVLLTSMALLGCSSTLKQDYDILYDFSQLKYFSILEVHSIDDPFIAERVAKDIHQALTKQGFSASNNTETSHRFFVNYAIKTEDNPKSAGLSIGLGTGTWGNNGGASIGTNIGVPIGSNTAKVLTIQIDIIDSIDNRLIWRGTDSLDFDLSTTEKAQKTTQTVYKILSQFPPK